MGWVHQEGARVKLVYGKQYRKWTTLTPGSEGIVKVRPRGRGPKNYGVLLDDGRMVVVPWGNLRTV